MKAVNASLYNIVLKGEVWHHNVPPCSKSAVCLLANNESVVTWLSPKDDMDNCLTHIPVILFKEKYWTLSLRMSKCIYRHIRLRKGFSNIQNVHGVQTLRIPQLLLNEKKRTQARFEVRRALFCAFAAVIPPESHRLLASCSPQTIKARSHACHALQKMHIISKRRPSNPKEPKPLYSTKHR
jgi:hypothetical protein